MFSLAVVFWELMQPYTPRLSNPFTGLDSDATLKQIYSGVRPPWGAMHSVEVQEVLCRAWSASPEERPTCQQLLESIEQVMTERIQEKDESLS